MNSIKISLLAAFLFLSVVGAASASAIDSSAIPNPADIGRIKPEEKMLRSRPKAQARAKEAGGLPSVHAPEGAEHIRFILKDIHITGTTIFSQQELDPLFADYLTTEISLKTAYDIAHKITKHYQHAGYFLSVAYLPDQEISDGTIKMQVVEGHIGKVHLPESLASNSLISSYVYEITQQRPLRAQTLETLLLLINDLPGLSAKGTLSELKDAHDGGVELTIETSEEQGTGLVSFDNYSSRFLGPHQGTLSYTDSFIPFHQTNIAGLMSAPTDKLKFLSLGHNIAITPDITFEFAGNHTQAAPGYTLKPFEIESTANFLSGSLRYQFLRQREQNLAFRVNLDMRNTTTESLNTEITQDHIRALRIAAEYDTIDSWDGYTIINTQFSQGIGGLGSTPEGDSNLSRQQASPDFSKIELSVTRIQALSEQWSFIMSAASQIASDPLYSAEEFGYGGQGFGRAFDASEIIGDSGVLGSLELRYSEWKEPKPVGFEPYVFYDMGRIWNKDSGQSARESGSSIGFGVRATTDFNMSANLGVAFPVNRDVITPIYGDKNNHPRLLFEITHSF
ncbi:MAG: ShlB/FhaC/HecB family hemolysin secretion/activation protein [Alphaproteobacteria bacterium]|nr:MAG: ShlB/FhaC/HecB family hemolysin secretion/activation protein [Alphaproteobacteria bacterium]